MVGHVQGLGALNWASEFKARKRLAQLEARSETHAGKGVALLETACSKVRAGGRLTRAEVAAYLGVSTRMIQRMESAGRLKRCPGLGTLVRYESRVVLQAASANGKER